MENTQLLSQKRAEHALSEIQRQKEKLGEKEQDSLAKLAASAPAMILQNGLGQTFAFFLAKGKSQHMNLFESIQSWLAEYANNRPLIQLGKERFLEHLHVMKVEDYLLWQREALAYLEWLKRYAAAFLEKEKVEAQP